MTWVAAGVASAALTAKGIQAYKANRDKKKAKKEQDDLINNRPMLNSASLAAQDVSPVYDENINRAKGVQSMYDPLTKTNKVPGQGYAESTINNNAANAVAQGGMAGFSSPSQYVQLLASASSGQRQAQTDLAIAGAQNRQDNMANYAQASNNVNKTSLDKVDQQQAQWAQNIFSPYSSKVGQTTQMIKDFTQRQREREDSAIETGVGVGSIASGANYAGGQKKAKKKKNDASLDPGSTDDMNSYTIS